MWCRQCQQDVPVSRSVGGGAVCPRCRAPLKPLGMAPTDAGIALESYDAPAKSSAPLSSMGSMRKPWELDSTAADLRRIGRRLRPIVSAELRIDPALGAESFAPAPTEEPTRIFQPADAGNAATIRQTLWSTIAIDLGLLTLIGGAAAMAARMQGAASPLLWQGGMIGVAAGGAIVALGLLWKVAAMAGQNRRLRDDVTKLRDQVKSLKAAASECEGPFVFRGMR